jgi:hypothetical protein
MKENNTIPVINVSEWLESTKKNDITIELLCNGKWVPDRYMRTCTIKTGIQELLIYRRMHDDSNIRLLSDIGTSLDIHFSGKEVKWC